MRIALAMTLLVFLCGCGHPEDKYKGKEHWVTTSSGVQTTGDYKVFEYDLGSVRRVGSEVIFNFRTIEDDGAFDGLSQENKQRKAIGAPIVLKFTSVAELDCSTRRVTFSEIYGHLSDGTVSNIPDRKLEVIPPNSHFEKIYNLLCDGKGDGSD